MHIESSYWDTACFSAYFNQEEDRYSLIDTLLKEAAENKIKIVTSALTIAEVLKPKREYPVSKKHRESINNFFKQEFIIIRNITRKTAELAQDLFWDCQVNPKDALHVATAIEAGSPSLYTFDHGLIARSTKVGGNPTLVITLPVAPPQGSLIFPLKR